MRSLLWMSAVIVAAAGFSGCCIHHSCGTGDCGCTVGLGRLACGGCGECDDCQACGVGARGGFFDRLMIGSGRLGRGCASCGTECSGDCGGDCGNACGGRGGLGAACGLRGRMGCCESGCSSCQTAQPAAAGTTPAPTTESPAPLSTNDAACNDCGGCGRCRTCLGGNGGLFGGRFRREVVCETNNCNTPACDTAPAAAPEVAKSDCGTQGTCDNGTCSEPARSGLFGGRIREGFAVMSARAQALTTPAASSGPACGGCGNCSECGFGRGGRGGLLGQSGGGLGQGFGGGFGQGGGFAQAGGFAQDGGVAQGGGLLGRNGGGLFGQGGGVIQAGGWNAGCDNGVCQAGGLGGDHGCGRNGCGVGGKLCLGCQWKSLWGGHHGPIRNHLAQNHPYGGNIPHTPNAQLYGQGPMTPTYAYPYYTTRGPRDFLLDACGPAPIVPSSPRTMCLPSIGY